MLEKKKKHSQAENYLGMIRNGDIDPPDADSIPFPDGSVVVWDGQRWEVSPNA